MKSLRFSVLLIPLLLLGMPAWADGDRADHDRARQAMEAGEILPLRQILDRVEKDYPGQVLEVELEHAEEGRWVYEIKLLRPEGAMNKLKVDARSGRTLEIRGKGRVGDTPRR